MTLSDDLLPLVDEEDEILPSNETAIPQRFHMTTNTDQVPLLPATLPEIIRSVREPTRELVVGIICDSLETAVFKVFQNTATEKRRAVVTDADESSPLDLVPVIRDDDVSMVDRDAAVDDVEAFHRLLDRGLDEIRIVNELNFDEVSDLLRETSDALGSPLRDDASRVLDVVEEDVDIASRHVLVPLGGGLEILVRGLIEHQLPGVATAEPTTLVESLIDERDTSHESVELAASTIAESLLDRDDVEAHGYFRPRRAARMRPKTARTKVKSQNLRMIAS